jgi:hypothetical protein
MWEEEERQTLELCVDLAKGSCGAESTQRKLESAFILKPIRRAGCSEVGELGDNFARQLPRLGTNLTALSPAVLELSSDELQDSPPRANTPEPSGCTRTF